MNTPNPARTWWDARAPRERWMVGTMLACVAVFAFHYALMQPLSRLDRDQTLRYQRAAGALAALQAAHAARTEALTAASLPAHAHAAGIPQVRIRPVSASEVEVDIDAAPAASLIGWLDRLDRTQGLAPSQVSITREEAGVTARLRLPLARPAGQPGTDLP